MYLTYEDSAWRIDDWFNWDYAERGFNGSMREDLRKYIVGFAEQIPRFRRGE